MEERKQALLRNIILLRWQGFLAAFRAFVPIQYIYFQLLGLNYTEISFIVGAFFCGMFLLEVPSGAFSDRWGRKNAIVVSAIALTFSFVIFYFSTALLPLMLANFLQGVGEAFNSGSDEAIIHDSLAEVGKEEEFARCFGKKWEFFMYGAATSSCFSRLLPSASLEMAFLVSAIAGIGSLMVASRLREPEVRIEKASLKVQEHLGRAWNSIRANRTLRALIIYSLTVTVAVQIYFQYIQFLLINSGMKVQNFGIIYAGFIFICGYSARWGHVIVSRFERSRALLIVLMILVAGLILSSVCRALPIVLIGIVLVEIVFGLLGPIVNSYFQSELKEQSRATAASIRSFATGIAVVIAAPILGLVTDKLGLENMLVVLLIVTLSLCLLALTKLRRSALP